MFRIKFKLYNNKKPIIIECLEKRKELIVAYLENDEKFLNIKNEIFINKDRIELVEIKEVK